MGEPPSGLCGQTASPHPQKSVSSPRQNHGPSREPGRKSSISYFSFWSSGPIPQWCCRWLCRSLPGSSGRRVTEQCTGLCQGCPEPVPLSFSNPGSRTDAQTAAPWQQHLAHIQCHCQPRCGPSCDRHCCGKAITVVRGIKVIRKVGWFKDGSSWGINVLRRPRKQLNMKYTNG